MFKACSLDGTDGTQHGSGEFQVSCRWQNEATLADVVGVSKVRLRCASRDFHDHLLPG